MNTEACIAEPQRSDVTAVVARLRFFVPRAVLTVGEWAHIEVVAEDGLGTAIPDVPVAWRSSAPGTVAVDATGMVEALDTGEARIVAAAGPVTAELSITASRVGIKTFGVHPARKNLCVGEHTHIDLDVADHRGPSRDPRIVAWTSSDPSIARVSPDGDVTALKHGQARITAATGNLSAAAEIEVVPLVPSKLTASPAALTLELGATEQLKAVVTSQRGMPMPDAVLQWQSSDPKVVWVDLAGTIRGLALGSAKIRVACGSFSGTTAVRVFAPRA